MDKPTVTIDGVAHEIRNLKVRDWKNFTAFIDADIKPSQPDFIEKHAEFIANAFDGVTAADILDLPLKDILPLYDAIQNYLIYCLYAKLDTRTKDANAESEKTKEESK